MFPNVGAIADADISDENYIVLLKLLKFVRESCDVVRPVSFLKLWMEQKAIYINARISRKSITDESIFPARQGLDDESPN